MEGRLFILISGVCLLIWFAIWMGSYFGRQANELKNISMYETEAYIESHSSFKKECSKQCHYDNCWYDSNGNYKCETIYYTCYYTCYEHYLYFKYTPDPLFVQLNETRVEQLYMYTTDSPAWNDKKYQVGSYCTICYNICPLKPIHEEDQLICQSHGNRQMIRLNYYPDVSLWRTEIASFFFMVLFGLILMSPIAYMLIIKCNNKLHEIQIQNRAGESSSILESGHEKINTLNQKSNKYYLSNNHSKESADDPLYNPPPYDEIS
jgi:hypothetical protein